MNDSILKLLLQNYIYQLTSTRQNLPSYAALRAMSKGLNQYSLVVRKSVFPLHTQVKEGAVFLEII